MAKTTVRGKKANKGLKVYVVTKTAICNEDPEDSIFEIVGVFKNRPDAVKAKNADQKKEDEELQYAEEDGYDPYPCEMLDFEYEIKPMDLK